MWENNTNLGTDLLLCTTFSVLDGDGRGWEDICNAVWNNCWVTCWMKGLNQSTLHHLRLQWLFTLTRYIDVG